MYLMHKVSIITVCEVRCVHIIYVNWVGTHVSYLTCNVMAVVVRTLGTCRIPVMCTNEDSQSQREDQVQKGKEETERERITVSLFS